jgi:hypothetical protein
MTRIVLGAERQRVPALVAAPLILALPSVADPGTVTQDSRADHARADRHGRCDVLRRSG